MYVCGVPAPHLGLRWGVAVRQLDALDGRLSVALDAPEERRQVREHPRVRLLKYRMPRLRDATCKAQHVGKDVEFWKERIGRSDY